MTNWINITQEQYSQDLAILGKLGYTCDYNHSEKEWTYFVGNVPCLQKKKRYNSYSYYVNTNAYKDGELL